MQYIRQTIFAAKGMFEFTKGGYSRASRHFNEDDVNVDMSGKSVVITGANSGIGLETAIALAEKGAQVHILCRNASRGQQALEKVKLKSRNGVEPKLHIVDMSRPREVLKFTEDYVSSGQKLHVLINNAGCMNHERVMVDGIESNFSTNTLGPYILTKGLLSVLENDEDSRVITVSSGGMYTEKLNYFHFNNDAMENFDGTSIYAQNKRQQVVMMEEFALAYPKVFFATMHPGWADTEAVKISMPAFYKRLRPYLRTPAQAADTVIWLSTVPAIRSKYKSGQFFQDRTAVKKHLPFAGTESTPEQNKQFINSLNELARSFVSDGKDHDNIARSLVVSSKATKPEYETRTIGSTKVIQSE